MSTADNVQAITAKGDPVAQWAELQVLYPEAARSFDEGWHYGSLRPDDPVVRETTLVRLIDVLLDREMQHAAGLRDRHQDASRVSALRAFPRCEHFHGLHLPLSLAQDDVPAVEQVTRGEYPV